MPAVRLPAQRWVDQLKMTGDARGDIVEVLKRYRGLPSVFPNQAHFYRFVRDKLKLTTDRQLNEVPSLYAEWRKWKLHDDKHILDDIPARSAASG